MRKSLPRWYQGSQYFKLLSLVLLTGTKEIISASGASQDVRALVAGNGTFQSQSLWSGDRDPVMPPTFTCSSRWNLVVSYGGVGTTSTIRQMETAGSMVNNVDDKDGLKHKPWQRTLEHVNFLRTLKNCSALAKPELSIRRIMYVYGDPVHAVVSLYRRSYVFEQFEKVPRSPVNTEEARRRWPTLVDYATAGDPLGLIDHVFEWERAACNPDTPPIIFVDSHLLRNRNNVMSVVDFFLKDGPPVLPRLDLSSYEEQYSFEASPRNRIYTRDPERVLNISKEDLLYSIELLERTYKPLRDRLASFKGVYGLHCTGKAWA